MQNDRTNSDLENTRRDLIALRNAHGADTPVGYRCSNLIELLQNYDDAESANEELALSKLIVKQMADLDRLRHAFQ